MKKLLLMALVAMMGFAAQAVTLNWNKSPGVGEQQLDNSLSRTVSTIDFSKTVAVKLVYTDTTFSPSGKTDVFSLCLNNTTNSSNSLVFRAIGGGAPRLVANDTGWGYNNKQEVAGAWDKKQHTFDLVFNFETRTGTLQFDSGDVINLDYSSLGMAPDKTLGIVLNKVDGLTYDSLTVTYTLPEPTVLALLALGVAGLALKRKVA